MDGERGELTWTVVAVHGFTGIAVVGVGFEVSFGDFEVLFWDDLVQGVGSSRENFAGVAMAVLTLVSLWYNGFSSGFEKESLGDIPEDMLLCVELNLPFGLTTVAPSCFHFEGI
jgi:hypothetical protein